MTDKIRPETLIALDLMRAKDNDEQLPATTVKWIAEHGKPDIQKVLHIQRRILDQRENDNRYVTAVLKAIDKYGSRSPEAIHAYKIANYHKIGFKELSALSGLDYSWIYNKLHPSREHEMYSALVNKYKDANSPEVINYIKYLYKQGYSLYKIGMWTGMKNETVKHKIFDN